MPPSISCELSGLKWLSHSLPRLTKNSKTAAQITGCSYFYRPETSEACYRVLKSTSVQSAGLHKALFSSVQAKHA